MCVFVPYQNMYEMCTVYNTGWSGSECRFDAMHRESLNCADALLLPRFGKRNVQFSDRCEEVRHGAYKNGLAGAGYVCAGYN